MTPRHYHATLQPDSTRVRCPVCHEAVYSRAGIHPQCAVRQSDPPRPKNRPAGVPVEGETVGAVDVATPPAAEATSPAARPTAPPALAPKKTPPAPAKR